MADRFEFPDDDTGAYLHLLTEMGVNLTLARKLSFTLLASDGLAAAAMSAKARDLGYSVSILPPDEELLDEGLTEWAVTCRRHVMPTHANITRILLELETAANALGCRADGWYFAD